MTNLFKHFCDHSRRTVHNITFRSYQILCWVLISLASVVGGQGQGSTTGIQDKLRDGDEFANNLISDLAPLLTLFGEKFAQQFLSFSTSWADSIIFSMAPLGVITAIVGAIRVGGPSWLRSIIGRARETTAAAEVELMSSTSHEVCELWNGDSIVRVMGSPRIQQLIYFQGLSDDPVDNLLPEDQREPSLVTGAAAHETTAGDSGNSYNIFTLEEAKRKGYLEPKNLPVKNFLKRLISRKENNTMEPDISQAREEAPNISLNLAARVEPWELYSAVVFGILVQVAVLIVGGVVTYAPGWKFKKGGLVVSSYSFPLNAIGTLMLVHGMFIMASVIEQCTHEDRWIKTKKTGDAKMFIIWLQRGRVINDQEFGSFGLVTNHPLEVIRTSRRQRRKSPEDSRLGLSSRTVQFFTVLGTGISVVGFILQFMGLRGLHWLASTAQLAATVLMTTIRALLRRGISKRPVAYKLTKDFELEWLAAALAKNPNDFGNKYRKSNSKTNVNCGLRVTVLTHQTPREQQKQSSKLRERQQKTTSSELKPPNALEIIRRRSRLGQLSHWTSPASDVSIATTNAIEAVMNILFPDILSVKDFDWTINLRCGMGKCNLSDEVDEMIQLSVTWTGSRWEAKISQIEAILSHWLMNARDSESEKKKYQASQPETSENWLRRKPRNQNMRFLGPDSIGLRRDLRWWTPDGAFSLLQVLKSDPIMNYTQQLPQSDDHTIDYSRITGFNAPILKPCCPRESSNSFHQENTTGEESSCDLSKPVAIRFKCKTISLEELGMAPNLVEEGPIDKRKELPIQSTLEDTRIKGKEESSGHALAMITSTTIEILFGQHIFGTFMAKVATELKRIGGESIGSQATRTRPSAWHKFRLTNTVVSQLALEVQNAGLATTLDEAFVCIIPPLSREHKLPIEAAVDYVLETIDEDERRLNWEKCTETYVELLRVCKEFNSEKCLFTIKVATAIMAYTERLKDSKELLISEGPDTNEANILNSSIETLQKRVAEDMSSTILTIGGLLKRLYNLQSPGRDALLELYISRDLKEYQKNQQATDLLRFVGYTEIQATISQGAKYLRKNVRKANINDQDIVGWSVLHYLVCQPGSISELFSTNVRYLIDMGVDPNLRDISGRTPLHYAALQTNPTIISTTISLIKEPEVILDLRARDGRTALHYAALKGNKLFVDALIKRGAQINILDHNRHTPLHLAVIAKDQTNDEVVELLARDLSTRIQDYHQRTVLHLAAVMGNMRYLKLLFYRSNPIEKDRNGRTALHLAVLHKKEEFVKFLLNKNVTDVEDNEGQTVLHFAALTGDEKMVKLLLLNNVGHTKKRHDGQTPLHLAVANKEGYEATKLIVCEGSKEDLDIKDVRGRTPVHIAAEKNAKATVLLLDKNADSTVADYNGDTPLHICCQGNNVEAVTRMLNEKSKLESIINSVNKAGQTPLQISAENSYAKLTALLMDSGALLDSMAVDPHFARVYRHTVLHSAVRESQLTLVKLLLEAKGNIIDSTNFYGQTALHLAAEIGNEELVGLLLEYHPSIYVEDIQGNTALGLACASTNLKGTGIIQKLLLKEPKQQNALLDHAKKKGETPIYAASKINNEKSVNILIEKGANICAQTRKGRTALHVASKRGFANIVETLLRDKNRDQCLELKDNKGETALHLSCSAWRQDSTKTAIILIDSSNVSVDLENYKGETVLHCAAKSGRVDLVQKLLERGYRIDSLTKKKRTALHQSAKRGQQDVVCVLLDFASKSKQRDFISIKDFRGETALHLAFRYRHRGVEIIKLLVEHYNAPINIKNLGGENVLHYAASSDDDAITKILIKADTKGNATNQEDDLCQSPLHRSVIADREYGIIRLMLSNNNTVYGDAALHSEILGDTGAVILSSFYNKRKSMNFLDKHGWLPALCFSESGQRGWLEFLRDDRPDLIEENTHMQGALLTPHSWEIQIMDNCIEHSNDGLEVEYLHNKSLYYNIPSYEHRILLADHPLYPTTINPAEDHQGGCTRYFEITVQNLGRGNEMGIGLSNGPIADYRRLPGWDKFSWGYHSDDGNKYIEEASKGFDYGPKYIKDDIVGCGVRNDGSVFFTKNGKDLGQAFDKTSGQLFPAVGLSPGGKVRANFGNDLKKDPFVYNVDEDSSSPSSIKGEDKSPPQSQSVREMKTADFSTQSEENRESPDAMTTKELKYGSEAKTLDSGLETVQGQEMMMEVDNLDSEPKKEDREEKQMTKTTEKSELGESEEPGSEEALEISLMADNKTEKTKTVTRGHDSSDSITNNVNVIGE